MTRIYTCPTYTISRIRIDDVYVCDAVEDTDRGLDQEWTLEEIRKKKVYRMTAIPTGIYDVTLAIRSPKFYQKDYYKKFCGGYLPRILNIKGFDGVLFHRGASADSSAGCVILGFNTIKGRVTSSQKAFEKFYKILKTAHDKHEKITLKIIRNYKV